ncbi:MAG: hypothetical protein ACR2NN_07555 [Bryobacteraceae bacterium]
MLKSIRTGHPDRTTSSVRFEIVPEVRDRPPGRDDCYAGRAVAAPPGPSSEAVYDDAQRPSTGAIVSVAGNGE